MSGRNFRAMLEAQSALDKFVWVGLDTNRSQLPEVFRKMSPYKGIFTFNCAIVDATRDIVCGYKLQSAYYEAWGSAGLRALRNTIAYINKVAPDVPTIDDAKRGDIDSTNDGYVQMAFEWLRADAITVHPYLGAEALKPFLDREDKGIIVLCRTSNDGAGEFQDIPVPLAPSTLREVEQWLGREVPQGAMPLYQYVAYRVAAHWNANNNCAVVVGANYPQELREVRRIVRDMPILNPAIGFQQKDVPLERQVEQLVSMGKDSRKRGILPAAGRSIIFASKGEDFAEAAHRETLKLHNLINQYR